jgi:ubiquinone/menaquinone biosynthesis C-methylase UbiE
MNKTDIKEYFDRHANKRDKWRKRNRYYHKEVKNLLTFLVPESSTVLDIGCSTGDVLANLKPNRGVGIDISPKVISIAQEKYPHLIFKEFDAESLDLNEKFDYIVLSDVIGFFTDVQQAFSQLQNNSHSQTKIIITYYNYLWEPIMKIAEKLSLKMKNPIQNWLSKSDVDNFLYLADFEVIKKGERLIFPKKIPLLSSFLNHFLAKFPLFRNLCLVNFVVARPKPTVQPCKANPSVSIIIPARNERGNIEAAIKRTPKLGSHTEIVFVEGHSDDKTLEEMHRVKNVYTDWDIKVMVQDGKGKGDAVRKGFDAATGDILMILDADLTVRPEELPKFYQAIASGAGEFINGSRLVYPLEDESMRLLNIFGNKFFSMMFSWLLDQRLKDTLCGTKVIWKDDYEKLTAGRAFFGDFDPFGDYDLLFGAAKLNLKIIDLPIRYQARTYGSTNISRFSHGWLLLKMCFFAMKKIKFI